MRALREAVESLNLPPKVKGRDAAGMVSGFGGWGRDRGGWSHWLVGYMVGSLFWVFASGLGLGLGFRFGFAPTSRGSASAVVVSGVRQSEAARWQSMGIQIVKPVKQV